MLRFLRRNNSRFAARTNGLWEKKKGCSHTRKSPREQRAQRKTTEFFFFYWNYLLKDSASDIDERSCRGQKIQFCPSVCACNLKKKRKDFLFFSFLFRPPPSLFGHFTLEHVSLGVTSGKFWCCRIISPLNLMFRCEHSESKLTGKWGGGGGCHSLVCCFSTWMKLFASTFEIKLTGFTWRWHNQSDSVGQMSLFVWDGERFGSANWSILLKTELQCEASHAVASALLIETTTNKKHMPVRQNRTQNPDWMKGDSHFFSVSVSDVPLGGVVRNTMWCGIKCESFLKTKWTKNRPVSDWNSTNL